MVRFEWFLSGSLPVSLMSVSFSYRARALSTSYKHAEALGFFFSLVYSYPLKYS